MAILGVPPVNPGGDGYAAWLGTQGHRGMADIYEWANGRSGRYSVETPLNFPSKLVPKGTGDLLDRHMKVFVDWKFMGTWSLKKLRESGPSETYRVQVHTYSAGALYRGEKVDWVAIAGLPRQGASLDEMYVWAEPVDKTICDRALARVEHIARRIAEASDGAQVADIAALFSVSKDCTYCPHHLPKSSDLGHACNGRE
jgi:hypothetical protein